MTSVAVSPATIRRVFARCLAGALVVSALVACAALLSGSWDDTDWRVIGTSAIFAVFSGLASSGAAARLRGWRGSRSTGAATIATAATAAAIAVAGIWTDGLDLPEVLWRICGLAGLAAVVLSHACLVIGGRRPTDTQAITTLVTVSIALAVIDAIGPALAIVGAFDHVDADAARLLAVLLVLLVLTTALPPVLRRLAPDPQTTDARATRTMAADDEAAAAFGAPPRHDPVAALAEDVLASVDRLERLDLGGPAERELEHLRNLAAAAASASESRR